MMAISDTIFIMKIACRTNSSHFQMMNLIERKHEVESLSYVVHIYVNRIEISINWLDWFQVQVHSLPRYGT